MSRFHFKSVTDAVTAVRFFNKKSKSKAKDGPHSHHHTTLVNKGSSLLLEDFTDHTHQQPPQHHASLGDLQALQDAVTTFGLTLREWDRDNSSTLLHHASAANQVSVMRYLIQNGVGLDVQNGDGDTPLHLAARGGHADAVHLLLESGASSGIANNSHDVPLHTAARESSGRALEALLSHPVDCMARGHRNRSVLHILAECDNVEGCKVLFKKFSSADGKKCNVKLCHCTRDDDGLAAIHLAARKNSYRILDHFLTFRCRSHTVESMLEFIDEENSTPLHAAVDAGNLEVVRVLLKHGASPLVLKEDIPPPLHLACSQGRLEVVRAMVESAGTEILRGVDQNGKTPLHYATFSIHSRHLIAYILDGEEGRQEEEGRDRRCEVDQQDNKGKTPLHLAVSSGNLTSVKELLMRGSDPFIKDLMGHNALHFAVLYNRTAIIQMLLEVDGSEELANDVNARGYSPMHIGLKLGQRDIVSKLTYSVQLCPHRSCCIKDPHGNNYIHLAASHGDWKVLSTFLELSNTHKLLNETNDQGDTPLHHASKNGHTHCVELLLNCGAMVHRSHKGVSPLMLACRNDHTECVKLLVRAYPFQMDWQNEEGDTALHYAARGAHPATLRQLLDLGAQVLQNDHGRSFLDVVVKSGSEECGLTVVRHSRWRECLDVVSTTEEDPMLGLIKEMPTVAKAVLDRSHTVETLTDNNTRIESFNFQYLITHSMEQESQEEATSSEKSSSPPILTRTRSRKDKVFYEVAITDLEVNSDLRNMTKHRKKSVIRRPVVATPPERCKKRRGTSPTTEVLRRMIQYKRVDLLIHPVVSAYLKKKWKSYGRLCYAFYNSPLVLLVFCLTMYVILSPNPAYFRTKLEQNVTFDNSSSDNVTLSDSSRADCSTTAQVFRWLAVVFNTMYGLDAIIGLAFQGWRSINLVERIIIWNSLTAFILNYVFLLLSSDPFSNAAVGAVACFFSWLVLFGALEFFDIVGIYVNMFYKILRTVFQVLIACTFLLVAFALAMYLLASSVTEFSNLGFSLFSVFGYMLGEIQYSLFIEKATMGGSAIDGVIIVFILLLAIMMSIVMANLLIGLAVGDIEQIKLNALYQRRTLEVSYFAAVDSHVPRFLQHVIRPTSHVECHSRNPSWLLRIKRYLAKTMRSEVLDRPPEEEVARSDPEAQPWARPPVDVGQEIVQIKQKLKEMLEMMHNYREEEMGDRKRRHWHHKHQSALSLESDISMTASDFLADLA